MLAFAWLWHDAAEESADRVATRLGNSLCSGIGGEFSAADMGALHFAYRPFRSGRATSRSWRPATLPSGRIAAFHGYFDNADAIASELGCSARDLSQLYGLAVDRWGDDADLRIVGEYCAVIADPGAHRVRLSRSPLRAPPLYYSHDDRLIGASSVPRALFAVGIEQRANYDLIADSALFNRSDKEASWFEGVLSVPKGCVVFLEPGRERRLRQYYDVGSLPDIRLASDAEYIARASELLDEGVRACLAGSRHPGATLSGGLDSPQVALRALKALPHGQKLPTFTFHPEPGSEIAIEPGKMGDERPFVEAFTAMHPRLEPHFTANPGIEHDYRLSDFFHLMGAAPPGLANNYVLHGIFAEAAKQGCDLLLLAEWGNLTFSDSGVWAFPEYLVRGRWRQLWLALRNHAGRDRSLLWRLGALSLLPFLPERVWRWVRRVTLPRQEYLIELIQPLSRDYRARSGADRRLKAAGFEFERYQPRNRRHAAEMIFRDEDSLSEIYQGFEQMYGIAHRDPTAYRPFAEFCFGLPTEMFMRDGVRRWLAKQMAKGIMPEEQRTNRLDGRWDSDWYTRIGRRRESLLEELDRLERDQRMAGMFDLPRLRSTLTEWPSEAPTHSQAILQHGNAVMRALVATRFIDYVEGRNDL
jgi:asparagine synthase (glutamine-hydrolysing)